MKFPDVELVGLEEKTTILSDVLKENKLNLVLFYNTNCLGCTGRAIPLAYKLQNEYDFLALTVIHSNFRSTSFTSDEVLSVFTDQKSPFNIYRELNHELYDYFDCEGTPHWLIINGKEELVHSFFGSQDGAQIKLNYAIQEYL
jgi:peroxiredoxin